jgi:hypothetical protein
MRSETVFTDPSPSQSTQNTKTTVEIILSVSASPSGVEYYPVGELDSLGMGAIVKIAHHKECDLLRGLWSKQAVESS